MRPVLLLRIRSCEAYSQRRCLWSPSRSSRICRSDGRARCWEQSPQCWDPYHSYSLVSSNTNLLSDRKLTIIIRRSVWPSASQHVTPRRERGQTGAIDNFTRTSEYLTAKTHCALVPMPVPPHRWHTRAPRSTAHAPLGTSGDTWRHPDTLELEGSRLPRVQSRTGRVAVRRCPRRPKRCGGVPGPGFAHDAEAALSLSPSLSLGPHF